MSTPSNLAHMREIRVRVFDLPVIPDDRRAIQFKVALIEQVFSFKSQDKRSLREMLNKHRQPYRAPFGAPLSAASLPAKSKCAIEIPRKETLALGSRHALTVSLIENTRRPYWA